MPVQAEKRLKPAFALFLFAISASIRVPIAQSSSVGGTVAAYRLESSGVDDSTLQIATDLLFSFIWGMNLGGMINHSVSFMESTHSEALADGSAERHKARHDYLMRGSLSAVPEGIIFELFLEGKAPGSSRSVSKTYPNPNMLMLGMRLLIRDLFESPVASGSEAQPQGYGEADALDSLEAAVFAGVASVDSLAGNWKGDNGIERITILRGGRGVAALSGGASIALALSVQDGQLIVRQSGRALPLQFPDLPAAVAEKAAQQAEPAEWRFRVSEDARILSGEKMSAQVIHDGQDILSISKKIEKATWVRN